MDKENIERLTALFNDINLAVLSTQKDGQPYASLVAYSASKDLKHLFFLTSIATRKYENLQACRKVALLIHSAENLPDDFTQAVSVTALGTAEPVTDKDNYLKAFLERHPGLSDFSTDPDTALIAVDVASYVIVDQFQNVKKVRMDN